MSTAPNEKVADDARTTLLTGTAHKPATRALLVSKSAPFKVKP